MHTLARVLIDLFTQHFGCGSIDLSILSQLRCGPSLAQLPLRRHEEEPNTRVPAVCIFDDRGERPT